jgi:hypothetical protein
MQLEENMEYEVEEMGEKDPIPYRPVTVTAMPL